MTVSVAMATYNGVEVIRRQLDSILPQLRETDELVISDDGSTDGTKEVLAELAKTDARVRVIDGPQHGLVANFERALSVCTGDVIFLCDQDDEWDADKMSTVLTCFEAPDPPLLVMHDARVVDGKGTVLNPSFFSTRNTRTGLLKNLWKNSYIGCCMAFSRTLLPYVLPFPATIPMHDQWIGLRAERCGRVQLLDRPLMNYRRHGNNASPASRGTIGVMLKQRCGMIRALMRR